MWDFDYPPLGPAREISARWRKRTLGYNPLTWLIFTIASRVLASRYSINVETPWRRWRCKATAPKIQQREFPEDQIGNMVVKETASSNDSVDYQVLISERLII
jgi:hypothetical protein